MNVRSRTARLLVAALGALSLVVSPAPRTYAGDDVVASLLASINAERSAQHLRPLLLNAVLCRLAYEHAADMAARHYFGHATPEGQSPFVRMAAAHYRFGYAGENVALDSTVDSIVRDFLDSREHRENLLGPHYTRVGIGAVSAEAGEIVVEDFSD